MYPLGSQRGPQVIKERRAQVAPRPGGHAAIVARACRRYPRPVPKRPPEDLHEWVSFDDPDEQRTWVWDLTFLTSNWSCLFGNGCPGIGEEPAPELEHGCCTWGAHFTDAADRAKVEAKVALLEPDEWQLRAEADKAPPIYRNAEGDTVSRVVDGACIFLNRADHPDGAGCALHAAALRRGESIVDWKPEVCWQVPVRRQDDTDGYGHVTSTIREWKRRDWGEGGDDFHWWCTEGPEAFIGSEPVWEACKEELIALSSPAAYASLRTYLRARASSGGSGVVPVPHPALKVRRKRPKN